LNLSIREALMSNGTFITQEDAAAAWGGKKPSRDPCNEPQGMTARSIAKWEAQKAAAADARCHRTVVISTLLVVAAILALAFMLAGCSSTPAASGSTTVMASTTSPTAPTFLQSLESFAQRADSDVVTVGSMLVSLCNEVTANPSALSSVKTIALAVAAKAGVSATDQAAISAAVTEGNVAKIQSAVSRVVTVAQAVKPK
jgi:hypothetical protein